MYVPTVGFQLYETFSHFCLVLACVKYLPISFPACTLLQRWFLGNRGAKQKKSLSLGNRYGHARKKITLGGKNFFLLVSDCHPTASSRGTQKLTNQPRFAA